LPRLANSFREGRRLPRDGVDPVEHRRRRKSKGACQCNDIQPSR
jgi:hypothetical protein